MCQTCNQIPCVREAVELVADATFEERVEEVWASEFGAQLFNLITEMDFPGKLRLYFSGRRQLTLAMIRALLLKQEEFPKRERSELR